VNTLFLSRIFLGTARAKFLRPAASLTLLCSIPPKKSSDTLSNTYRSPPKKRPLALFRRYAAVVAKTNKQTFW
jgi:hypothetical protein